MRHEYALYTPSRGRSRNLLISPEGGGVFHSMEKIALPTFPGDFPLIETHGPRSSPSGRVDSEAATPRERQLRLRTLLSRKVFQHSKRISKVLEGLRAISCSKKSPGKVRRTEKMFPRRGKLAGSVASRKQVLRSARYARGGVGAPRSRANAGPRCHVSCGAAGAPL